MKNNELEKLEKEHDWSYGMVLGFVDGRIIRDRKLEPDKSLMQANDDYAWGYREGVEVKP